MNAFIYDSIRTPVGRYGGSLSSIRTDDLAALPIRELMRRNTSVNWEDLDDLILGCANQAGEDNRNIARMAGLLAGLPLNVPGMTLNRLCGSGLDAVGTVARGIRSGDYEFAMAGGVESMSRAPFVTGKATTAFSRTANTYDTTIGWRFVNPVMKDLFGVDSMPETADNVSREYSVSREDQDAFAQRSQARWAIAHEAGLFNDEIMSVEVPQSEKQAEKQARKQARKLAKKPALIFNQDEHPRQGTTVQRLSQLKGINGEQKSVTAGNASGVNDGAAVLLLGNEAAAAKHGIDPKVRVVGMCSVGVAPRIMGIGPVPAINKLLDKAGLTLDQMDLIELNEAFAAQALAVMRSLKLPDDAEHVNPNGGAIAIGHPLGMSGSRLVLTAVRQLHRQRGRYGLCAMCVGVGQGIALIIERV